jgi:septal ring factor EnvC (AmiA/AmiB activator)
MMTVFSDSILVTPPSSSPRVKTRLLEQMAEALEDEAAGLYKRAAAFEEEEFLLNREIGERQTEINRLQLKLEALRAERDRVTDKIEQISTEATAVRERAFEGNEEDSLPAIQRSQAEYENPTTGALFFRRMTVGDQSPRP